MRRNIAIAIAAALLLSLTPALSQPQAPVSPQQAATPPGGAELKAARKAMRQACLEDIRALCAGSEPGGGKVLMCLRSHRNQVSEGCKAATQHLREVRRGA